MAEEFEEGVSVRDSSSPSDESPVEVNEEYIARMLEDPRPVQTKVAVDGLRRTSVGSLRPGIDHITRASTVQEAAERASTTAYRWRRMGLFEAVGWGMEPLGEPKTPEDAKYPPVHERDLVVRFGVQEAKGKWDVGVMTSATGVPELNFGAKNIGGRPYSASLVVLPSKQQGGVPSGELRFTSLFPWLGERCEYAFARRVETRLTSNRPCPIADEEVVSEAKVTVSTDAVGDRVLSSNVILGVQERYLGARDVGSMPSELRALFGGDSKAFLRATTRYAGCTFHEDERFRAMYGLPVGGVAATNAVELFWSNPLATGATAGAAAGGGPSLAASTTSPRAAGSSAMSGSTALGVGSTSSLNNTLAALDAAPGGTFLKHEWQLSKFIRLLPSVVLDLNASMGTIVPLSSTNPATGAEPVVPLSERLFLSWRQIRGYRSVGPDNLRHYDDHGYTATGSKPKVFRSLGGNLHWATSAVLNMPFLPYPNNGFIAMHAFANAGNVTNVPDLRPETLVAGWKRCLVGEEPSASIGAGLVVTAMPGLFSSLGAGRLELNWSLPIRFNPRTGAFSVRDDLRSGSNMFESIKWGLHWTTLT